MLRRYITTDVFTDRPFGGNPLAVVLDSEGLTTAQMQAIAREFNYAETTFVLPPDDPAHHARVRIFTPGQEVPFAGHPNVGTAFVLAHEATHVGVELLRFEELAGIVPVRLLREGDRVTGAELTAPEALSRHAVVSPARLAECVGLAADDVVVAAHAPQVISVGLPFLVAELASRTALGRARPELGAFAKLLPLDGADAIYLYVRDASDDAMRADLSARMFAPMDGIPEDPATGSATAACVALLAQLAAPPTLTAELRVAQGVDMGRPSLLRTRVVKQDGDVTSVQVGGGCVLMMRGTLELP